jgi:tRNA-dihydrouridine synthase
MKTGAGAALLQDADSAVAIARAARGGSGLPVTVKLRAEGVEVAKRLVEDAGVAGITFHPRTVKVRHKGTPDYDLAAQLVQDLPVPVIVTGGMDGADHVRWVFEYTGCEAVMLARGVLGNPWLFARLLGTRDDEPTTAEVLDELEWVMQRAVEHMGERRAGRYLRRFYPWYVDRIGGSKALQGALQATVTIDEARAVLATVDVVTIAA